MLAPESVVTARVRNALFQFCVADALSMPVHWFYNPRDIDRYFPGGVTRFHAAPATHPGSIMSLHSTRQGGRTSAGIAERQGQKLDIVGDVILKNKKEVWLRSGSHYHHGMEAGENTLNVHCARLLMRYYASGASSPPYSVRGWLGKYVEFMTTEGSHPDSYAESYHRAFFANLVAGNELTECAQLTHDTPSVGGLVTVAPLALLELLRVGAARDESVRQVQRTVRAHLATTHPSEELFRVADAYVALLAQILYRSAPAERSIEAEQQSRMGILRAEATRSVGGVQQLESLLAMADREVVGAVFGSACYISDSWPVVLYLAAKHGASPTQALLANTNAGGENCHRGAVLGSLVGLDTEVSSPLTQQLKNHDAIAAEIDAAVRTAIAARE